MGLKSFQRCPIDINGNVVTLNISKASSGSVGEIENTIDRLLQGVSGTGPWAIKIKGVDISVEGIWESIVKKVSVNLEGNIGYDLTNCYGSIINYFKENWDAFDYPKRIVSVRLPISVENIGSRAFDSFPDLQTIEGKGVISIENSAFSSCKSLEDIDFPMAETIGRDAFSLCTGLENVNFPMVKNIEDAAFIYCANIEGINFPSVETIGAEAFRNCTKLASVSFPKLKNINDGSSEEVEGRIGVSYIYHGAFDSCTNLKRIEMPELEIMGDYAFINCEVNTIVIGNNCNISRKSSTINNGFRDYYNNSFEERPAKASGTYTYDKGSDTWSWASN
jgi:hypothetical protein